MNTGSIDERRYLNNVDRIARYLEDIATNTNRIANALEANEMRIRRTETTTLEDLKTMGEAVAAVRRGFDDMEAQVRAAAEERELFGDPDRTKDAEGDWLPPGPTPRGESNA